MTHLYDIQNLMTEQLNDACTLKEFAHRAADALEDGEALAALGFTDADQSVIETAHSYYRDIENAEMTPSKFKLFADWTISFDGTMAYSTNATGSKVIFRFTGKEVEMPKTSYQLNSREGKDQFFRDLIEIENDHA